MRKLSRALFVLALLVGVVACGDDDTDADAGGDPGAADTTSDDSTGDDDTGDDDTSDDDAAGGDIDEGSVGTASLTVEPEGMTFEVGSSCAFAPESNSGTLDDLSVEGIGVSFAFDNTDDDDAAFPFNVVSETSVGADGTFRVRSQGGVDNTSVNYNGTGTAEIIESDGVIGRVRLQLDLVQAGPVTDPTGPPVFDDQPAERTVTGEAVCFIGIE